MEIYDIAKTEIFPESAIALGNFDGVHMAHKCVIARCADMAKSHGIKCGVMLFKTSVKTAGILSSIDERMEQIEKTDADFVILCEFDENFRKQSPEEFISMLKDKLNVKAVSAGYDYRFGHNASGDADTLARLAKEHNMDVSICEEQMLDGISVSSTKIRELITIGDIESANRFLGYDYLISGTVCHGFQNGRKLGFATANLKPEKNRILPPDGVYGGYTVLDGERYPSVINIGTNPTFDGKERTAEGHIIDFDDDIYGKKIKFEFKFFIRGEKKFPSVDELKKQISKDRLSAKEKLNERNGKNEF